MQKSRSVDRKVEVSVGDILLFVFWIAFAEDFVDIFPSFRKALC
jgi:hypothetical protein